MSPCVISLKEKFKNVTTRTNILMTLDIVFCACLLTYLESMVARGPAGDFPDSSLEETQKLICKMRELKRGK